MNKYQLQTIAGETYLRANYVNFVLPLDSEPYLLVGEERITTLTTGEEVHKATDQLMLTYDPVNTINPLILYDVDTGLPTGDTITQRRLHRILYSLYLKLATERDV
jgi:hypothetical protein